MPRHMSIHMSIHMFFDRLRGVDADASEDRQRLANARHLCRKEDVYHIVDEVVLIVRQLCADMGMAMRWACAVHRWKALAEAEILSIGTSTATQ